MLHSYKQSKNPSKQNSKENIPSILKEGLKHHQSGSLKDAMAYYEKILRSSPSHADALHLMGALLSQREKHSEAIRYIQKAIRLAPENAMYCNSLANVLQSTENFSEALCQYERAIDLQPAYPDAYANRGVVLQKMGRYQDALHSFAQLLALQPENANAHLQHGHALKALGHAEEARGSYEKATQLQPNWAEAHVSLGGALAALKRYPEAIQSYDRALALQADAQVFNLRGVAFHMQRNFQVALECYEQALQMEENHIGALYNRGSALAALKQFPQALACFDRVVELEPDNAGAFENRGNVLKELRRIDESVVCYEKAIELQPDLPFLQGVLLYAKHQVCDWDGLEANLDRLNAALTKREKVTPGFQYLALCDAPALQKTVEEIWANEKYPHNNTLGLIPCTEKSARIKVGYYSADFHNHATAYLMAEFFELHDRARFEVIGFTFGPDKNDAMRQRLVQAFEKFYDVRGKTSVEIAQLSRELGIDIAVDLKGYTTDSRPDIFAARCAPIQVNYLGYPGTMGVEFIDYLIADPVLIPEASRQHYTEKIAYLPDSYQVNDRHRQIADKQWTRADMGLPEQGFVFCCFNNNYKILPPTFDIWMRLLQQVPGSVLWLYESNAAVANNLRREAQHRGVAPERLVFAKPLPLAEHLARYPLADLFLDTLPCNAHTTTSDALWAGVPVLTQMGQSFAARVAGSLLTAIDLPELITETPQAYEARALELANDPAQLQALRAKLQANRLTAPLFDTPRFARHLEAAYAQMMERYWAGLAPEHFHITPINGPSEAPRRAAPDHDALALQTDKPPARGNRGLQKMVDEVREVLRANGMDAALDYVGRITATDGQHKTGQARVLSHVAASMLRTESATALALLEHAKTLAPDFADPHYIPISYFDNTGQVEKAKEAARFVIAAPIATPVQVVIAAQVLAGSAQDAESAMQAAKRAFEQMGKPLAWAPTLLDVALKVMYWDFVDELTEQLTAAHAQGQGRDARETPRTHVLWCANEAHNLEVTKSWNERDLPWPKDPLPPVVVQPPHGRRLRVGYLSGDFRNHPTSFLVNGLLRHHDPEDVELFAYCSGWDDGSEMRREVLSHFSVVHSVQGMTDRDAALMIRSHDIDVLVELNGPTRAHRMGILAYRPAPVQIDYLGYPGSVGGRVVDYVVGDSYTVPPGAEAAYPEKVIRIEHTYQVNDYAAYPPLPAVTRTSQGLPENVLVLGMFNAMNKVRGEVWAVWMRILREVPEAVLWILDPGEHADQVIDRVTKAHGITQGKRIYIASKKPQKDHLARMQCADLMLDPWPYGGHTTTSDALFAGVPVLALEGTNFAGRVSGGLLKAAGLECLVQPTTDAYVSTAVHLLRDRRDELARLQRFVREQVPKTDVFSAKTKARQLETAYRIAVERAAQGLPPIHLTMKMDLK